VDADLPKKDMRQCKEEAYPIWSIWIRFSGDDEGRGS
jgi:hypothetical protein